MYSKMGKDIKNDSTSSWGRESGNFLNGDGGGLEVYGGTKG